MRGNNTSVSVSNGDKSVTVQSSQPAKPIKHMTITQTTSGKNSPNTVIMNEKSIKNSNPNIEQDSSGNNSPSLIEVK